MNFIFHCSTSFPPLSQIFTIRNPFWEEEHLFHLRGKIDLRFNFHRAIIRKRKLERNPFPPSIQMFPAPRHVLSFLRAARLEKEKERKKKKKGKKTSALTTIYTRPFSRSKRASFSRPLLSRSTRSFVFPRRKREKKRKRRDTNLW